MATSGNIWATLFSPTSGHTVQDTTKRNPQQKMDENNIFFPTRQH